MPIKIPDTLPAKAMLEAENIFVMGQDRAIAQDIRPLKIVILNIMPTKISTEIQLLRLLSNSPLQVDITFIRPKSHTSKNTSEEHLQEFYKYFDEIKHKRFDGMIITGAPVEEMEFEEVGYWDELKEIIAWSDKNVFSTLFICWGAQAGLNAKYNVPKYVLEQKIFGVFEHVLTKQNIPLFRGFDDVFWLPHSRSAEMLRADVEKIPNLDIVSESQEAGLSIVMSTDGREIYIFGHGEYDADTLKQEYERDVAKGAAITVPAHYFKNDDPTQEPIVRWRAHMNLLFFNWLNYYVYQLTPYEID